MFWKWFCVVPRAAVGGSSFSLGPTERRRSPPSPALDYAPRPPAPNPVPPTVHRTTHRRFYPHPESRVPPIQPLRLAPSARIPAPSSELLAPEPRATHPALQLCCCVTATGCSSHPASPGAAPPTGPARSRVPRIQPGVFLFSSEERTPNLTVRGKREEEEEEDQEEEEEEA